MTVPPLPPSTAGTAPAPLTVRFTLVDPARARTGDVLVEAPPGATLGELREALAGAGPLPAHGAVAVAGSTVGDDAVAGLPPLLDGAVLVAGPSRSGPAPPALLEVHVVAGPDAGRRVPVRPGRWVVGRGPDATVRVEDRDVSRAHAAVTVEPDQVLVDDLGSLNGSLLAGPGQPDVEVEPGRPTPWPVGTRLVVGSSHLLLRAPGDRVGPDGDGDGLAATVPDGAGHLLVNRAPRVRPRPVRPEVRLPDEPAAPDAPALPWASLAVPLLLAVPMALWWRQPAFLLFALLSPLVVLAQHLLDRRGRRRAHRRSSTTHAAALARATAEIDTAVAAHQERLDAEHPDLARCTALAAGPERRLWERSATDPDALTVRVGLGEVPAELTVSGRPAPAGPPVHRRAPVVLDLLAAGVTGMAGPATGGTGDRLAHALVAQVAALHTPHAVRLVVRAADPSRQAGWAWAGWLPHVTDRRQPITLVVLDGAHDLRREPQVAALLAEAAGQAGRADVAVGAAGSDEAGGGRVVVLCLDDGPSRLPAECRATVVLHARSTGDVAEVTEASGRRRCSPDGVAPAVANRLGRDLARLRDATPTGADAGLPDAVTLPDLTGLPADPAGWPDLLVDRWRRPPSTPPPLRVTLGVTPTGPWTVDLRRHGPHALVAGTTGAGKSELLRSLVAALAVEHPPTEVTLLLVDYKGGAAFAGLEGLPHVCGLLTDLDPHSARRTLTSLRAELRRRERLLRAAGAADLDGYLRATGAAGSPGGPGRPAPVPRLVVVVDEFRVLAEELPDLLAGLVRVAALGRSLGVHLVLATQRPGGVVSADMRANLNLRVALRVQDRTDSDDVVETPAAACLPPDRPGRAVVRVGGTAPVTVQTALLSSPRGGVAAADPGHPANIRVRAWRPDPGRPPGMPPTGMPPTGMPSTGGAGRTPDDDPAQQLVRACHEAGRKAAIRLPDPPWLPALPPVLLLDDLPPVEHPAGTPGTAGPPGTSRPAPTLRLGLADRPDEQRREPLGWDLARGNLALVGGPRSGRSTAVRAVLAAASTVPDLHVHVLHGPGGCAPTARLAALGTVVPATDTDRAGRLLQHLAREPLPARWTLLLVDGWEAVAETLMTHERGRAFDDLVTALRDRGPDGVRVAAAGGRALLAGPVAGLLPTRLLLRCGDPTDLVLGGLAPDEVPAVMPAGRAVLLGATVEGIRSVVEAQVGLLDADPSPSAQDTALQARTARAAEPTTLPPLRLRPLPTVVDLGTLPVERSDGTAVVVGLGGDGAGPVRLPLPPGAVVLVAGGPGSGRTTALDTVARQAAAAGRVVLTVPSPTSPAAVSAPHQPTSHQPTLDQPTTEQPTTDQPTTEQPAVVLVDDVERQPAQVRARVEALVEAGATAVVVATAAEAAVAYQGLVAVARRSCSGLLLGPLDLGEAEALGVKGPAPRATVPGRGVVVDRGRPTRVQVARPPRE